MSIANFDKVLDDLIGRVYQVEQTVYGTPVDNQFSEIIVDDGTNPPVIITPQPPGIPTGLTATPGSFYDVIYADIEWTAPVGGEPAYVYEIEVAKKVAGIYDIAFVERTAGTNFRIQPLEPNTEYGVRVTAYSILGVHDVSTDWVDFNSGIDTSIPDAPTAVVIARGATSAIVRFVGSTAVDVAGGKGVYLIEIDTALTFDTGNKRTVRTTSTIFGFNDITAEGTWYARVAAIDSSGNQSAWATSTGYTAGAIVDNMIVAGLDAAKITFGTMSGDRITANTLDVTTIKTSTLTSANITVNGGSLKIGNPPTTGILINSQGIRLYAAGVLNVTMDAATGAASFKGNISASSISGGSISGATITGGSISGVTITGVEIFSSAIGGMMTRFIYGAVQFTDPAFPSSGTFGEISAGTDGSVTVSGANSLNLDGGGFSGSIELYSTTTIQAPLTVNNFLTATGNLTIGGHMSITNYISIAGGWVNLFPSGQIDAQKIHLFATGGITVDNDGYLNTDMPTTGSAANVNASLGTLQLVTSSEVGKTQIVDLHDKFDTKALHEFRPRTWFSRWHDDDLGGFDDPDEPHIGFVAEELETIDRRLVTYPLGPDSHIKGINWNAVSALLVAEVQRLRKDVDRLMAA